MFFFVLGWFGTSLVFFFSMKWFGAEFWAFLTSVEWFWTEFWAFSVPRNRRNSQKMSTLRPNPKKRIGVRDPMPELTITSPYVRSRVDFNTFTMGYPMTGSTLTICQSRSWFGLCSLKQSSLTQNFLRRFLSGNLNEKTTFSYQLWENAVQNF